MALKKPPSVEESPFRSKKWDELVSGRNFQPCHAPILSTLCYWYEVLETCMDDLTYNGEIKVAYQNDLGDLKAMPQLATMKQASAEIRAINKQLGINEMKVTPLHVIQSKREKRSARAKNTA